MMRIIAYFYGDVFFLNMPFNLGFKRNRHGGFRLKCLLDFLTLKVALNQVSHYFVFLVHRLGMLLYIIFNMQSSSLIFRKCSKHSSVQTVADNLRAK